jgi:hypothetical protein
MTTYSFKDVQANITGPGGSINLGYGSGASDEGVTIEMVEDKNKMDIGADGSVQHNLHAGNAATYTFHLQKVSPANQQLMAMYNAQRITSLLWGKNVITVANPISGDSMTGTVAAFKRSANMAYGKDAAVQMWAFDVGHSTGYLGSNNSNS